MNLLLIMKVMKFPNLKNESDDDNKLIEKCVL